MNFTFCNSNFTSNKYKCIFSWLMHIVNVYCFIKYSSLTVTDVGVFRNAPTSRFVIFCNTPTSRQHLASWRRQSAFTIYINDSTLFLAGEIVILFFILGRTSSTVNINICMISTFIIFVVVVVVAYSAQLYSIWVKYVFLISHPLESARP